MGDRTRIGWTDKTWNPWQGCHKVSPGCKFCYMFREKERYGQEPNVVVRSSAHTFNSPLRWHEPAMVFTCSWSDWFIEEADAWRDEAWRIIERTPHLTYQILTKRPERMAGRLPWTTGPWPHVWGIVSVEDQPRADERVPILLATPFAKRGVSYEPMLGPLRLPWIVRGASVDWVVAGGESGSERAMDLDWLLDISDQCRVAGIPLYVKQDSGPRPGQQGRIPDDLWIHEFPPTGRQEG